MASHYAAGTGRRYDDIFNSLISQRILPASIALITFQPRQSYGIFINNTFSLSLFLVAIMMLISINS
jgi:hypothetical protein